MTAPLTPAHVSNVVVTLKPAHAVVLGALGVANVALGRPVTPAEVAQALTLGDRRVLIAAYRDDGVGLRVAKVLDQLRTRALIFSPGRIGKARYYGHPQYLSGTAATLPTHTARRQRVLALLRSAVTAAGEPVQVHEVVTHAATRPDARDLTRVLIVRDLGNLLRTGDVVVHDTVRGGAVTGTNLYMPADMTLASLRTTGQRSGPRSWLQEVEATVATLWAEECAAAATAGRRPRPVTTPAVRAALAARATSGSTFARDGLADPRLVPNAMLSLAGGSRPYLRVVGAPPADAGGRSRDDATQPSATGEMPVAHLPGAALLWVPAAVPDSALDSANAYANDSARLTEAVRRACRHRAVPAVQRRAVEDEVTRDPALTPAGAQSIARLLSELVREQLADGAGGRQARVHRPILAAGRVGGETYYVVGIEASIDGTEVLVDGELPRLHLARAYVAMLCHVASWRALAVDDRLSAIAQATVPSIAFGRALALQAEVAALRTDALAIIETVEIIERAVGAGRLDGVNTVRAHGRSVIDAATCALTDIEDAVRRFGGAVCDPCADNDTQTARHGAADAAQLPAVVDGIVPGWTAAELLPILKPIYPAAQRVTDPIEMVPLLEWAVRRVPNPDFTQRRYGAELLFDQTDVLLYAAKQWGGHECLMLAGLAEHELGFLRDVRFVLPGLQAPAFDIRLAAVACLAFLWTDDARSALRSVALHDPEPGVRRAALWAYGFARGTDPVGLAHEMLHDGETHPLVDALVRQVLGAFVGPSGTAAAGTDGGMCHGAQPWWSW